MDLTILAVPDCSSAPVLEDRLNAILDGLKAGGSVSRKVIPDEHEVARWGIQGSPTLLIDGADPFADPGQPSSMSCRLYRNEGGQTSGAPSVGQLQQVIERALTS